MRSTTFEFFLFVALLLALYSVFMYVPTERQMGAVQRIFYFHVPSAMTAFLAYACAFVGSIQYLRTKRLGYDQFAAVTAELGVLFSIVVLITGPLWAKPTWGVYWRWEPRLTSMLIMFAMYVAYLMVRSYSASSPEGMRRIAAVLGIVSFVNVPFVYYSVYLWAPEQQLHPRSVELEPTMLHARYVCTIAVVLLFVYLLRRRLAQEQLAAQLDSALSQPANPS